MCFNGRAQPAGLDWQTPTQSGSFGSLKDIVPQPRDAGAPGEEGDARYHYPSLTRGDSRP